MKSKYRFIGDTASLYHEGGVIDFNRFGQPVELTDEHAAHLLDKALLLPEDEFSRLGFSDESLKQFPTAVSHDAAPDEFKQMKLAAIRRAHELREAPVTAPIDSTEEV